MIQTNAEEKGEVLNGDPLTGLDDVPWSELSHAYGPAEDVPELLRAIASGDPEAADEAIYELQGNVYHQGTVYEATVPAVPFLARLAAAGMKATDLVFLLGAMVEVGDDDEQDCGDDDSQNEDDNEQDEENNDDQSEEDDHSTPTGRVKAAVASQEVLISPFLHALEDKLRMAALWTLARSGPVEIVLPKVRARWDLEEVPSVRATILRALLKLDREQGTALAGEVLNTGTAVERLVAAWIQVSTGQPLSSDITSAATAWLAEGTTLDDSWWGIFPCEPFEEILVELSERGDVELATQLCAASLRQTDKPEVQRKTLDAIQRLVEEHRVGTEELGPALLPLLGDTELRSSVLLLLLSLDISSISNSIGGNPLSDSLYDLANFRGSGFEADMALECLIMLGDSRAPDLLASDLEHRPRSLSSAGKFYEQEAGPVLRFDQGLFDTIRGLLRTSSVSSPFEFMLQKMPPEGTIKHMTLVDILKLLAGWGSQAFPALPEIRRMIPHSSFGIRAIVSIGGSDPEVIATLRTLSGSETGDLGTRLTAASALQDLTGETEPLLTAIRYSLDRKQEEEEAARVARTIDDPPDWLVPALEAALPPQGSKPSLRSEINRTLCRFTGDVSYVVPLLQPSPFSSPVGGYLALEAARDAGSAAEPLIPELAKFLNHTSFGPTAADAIMSAGLGSFDLTTLADHVVTAVDSSGREEHHEHALGLLRKIRSRDRTAITPDMRTRLRDLTERSARVGGKKGRNDEALRKMIRDFLEESD